MNRIVVVGNSGSGKTTVSAALAGRVDVPHIELDALMHLPGWEPRDPQEMREILAERMAAADRQHGGWIVDGNYRHTRELVWTAADTLVWLDLPRRVVFPAILRRTIWRGLTRQELWNGNRETPRSWLNPDPEQNILLWSWTRDRVYRERYTRETAEARWLPLDVVRLRSRAEVAAWLDAVPGR